MSNMIVESISPPRQQVPTKTGSRSVELAGFEVVYRAHCDAVMAFFARRSEDPQTVVDLTADTFVEAMVSFKSFDPQRGTARSWLIGIARHVFAKHCESAVRERDANRRAFGRQDVDSDEIEELVRRIDAESAGRELMSRLSALAPVDRDAVELVELAGMTPKEAAAALGVSSGALRLRLFRIRTKLRKEISDV